MIARLFVLLPNPLSIPENLSFNIYEYEDSEYKIRYFPPMKSENTQPSDLNNYKINGIPTFQADIMKIDFIKDSFQREKTPSISSFDPPENIINLAVNSLLKRLRHVTKAPQLRELNFPRCTFKLQYLNDDETELEEDEKLFRVRFGRQGSISWIAVTKEIWDDINSLSLEYEPPPWEGLLLDAKADLPSIGPSIVLAMTALEVFISYLLEKLAENNNFPLEFWNWANNRNDHRQEPTIEEQYDFLLKFFTGHSLKEELSLWESFKNLKNARNSFVHEGKVSINKKPIDLSQAQTFVSSASSIIQKIKEWIPLELHWTEFNHQIKVETRINLPM